MSPNPLPHRQLRRLIEAAAAVVSETDLTSVLFRTVETARSLTDSPYGALGVLGEYGTLVEFIHSGMDAATAEAIGPPPRGRGVLGTITQQGKAVRIHNVTRHPDSVGVPAHHPEMHSFLGVPVRVGDRVYGNLYLTDKVGGYGDEDEQLVESLATIAGTAIATSRMQRRLRRVAVVEDRERIARDLHDAIIQDLFAVGLGLQAQSQRITDPEIRSALTETVQRLDEVIASLRRFIFDLRPPVWAQRSLRNEIADLLGHLAAPYSSEVHIDLVGDVDSLDGHLVEDTLRLVREAVNNALRHAETDRVDVRVAVEPEELLITVTDAGQGFDPDEVSEGMGLGNLRSRAERAGGEAVITSRAGEGTVVSIRIPL